MKWYFQWATDGEVFESEFMPDAEESAILRIAIGCFVDYWELACRFGIQHENHDIAI